MADMETAKISDLTESLTLNEDDYIVIENANGQNKKVAVGTLLKNVDSLPIGKIIINPGTTVPMGYMECDGRALSRTEYADLFAEIGTTYGSGDGSTTFNIPDFRETVPVGAGQSSRSGIAAHDTYALGEFKDDQFQGHEHNLGDGLAKLTGNTTVYPGVDKTNIYGPFFEKTTGVRSSDTHGTARVGNTTHGKQMGVQFIIHAYYYVVGDIGDIETLEATVASHGESISSLEGSVASHSDDIQYLSETKANRTELQNIAYSAIRGGKIAFMGDSITWGALGDLSQTEKPFPQVIAEKFGCTTVNYGIKGDTLIDNIVTGGMRVRTTQVDWTGVTHYVLFGGTNDQQNGYSWADIYTSLVLIAQYMKNWHPEVKFVVCSPIHKESDMESAGITLTTLCSNIKNWCHDECIPFIDLHDKFYLDFRNSFVRGEFAADKVHPNQKGYNVLGEYIGSKLAFNNFD